MIKSFPANSSFTLYGSVFLIRLDSLKSKVWSKLLFSEINLDLYLLPIKYGNCPITFPKMSWVDVAKYAYTPLGNSGVTQYLPLYSSRSPVLVNL